MGNLVFVQISPYNQIILKSVCQPGNYNSNLQPETLLKRGGELVVRTTIKGGGGAEVASDKLYRIILINI